MDPTSTEPCPVTDPAPPAAAAGSVAVGDIDVHRMGFGAMRVTGPGVWGEPSDRRGALAVLRRALDLGVNFIDTADSYGPEVSENLIAEALHPYPEDLVIGTKAGLVRPGPGNWVPNCRPGHLRQAVEGSLRRLRLSSIPLLQLHTVDRKVPLEESIGALAQLQDEGKILHIGVSNVRVEQLQRARAVARVVSVQNRYSVVDRASEDVLAACEQEGLAFLPWFPLARGRLAGTGGVIARIAGRYGATPVQIALAWLLAHSPIMLPIPGTSNVAHLEENVRAAELELSDEDLKALEQLAL